MSTLTELRPTDNELIRAHMVATRDAPQEELARAFSDTRLTNLFQASPRDYEEWLDEARAWRLSL